MTDKLNKLNKLMQGRKKSYVEKTPEDVYREVAGEFEHFEPEDIAKIGGVESQHGKYNKPLKGGSATGLLQFQPKTAEYLQPGSSETLEHPSTQADLMKLYLEKNKALTPEQAYAMHNLGPTGSRKFLEASDDTLIGKIIPRAVIKANPGLYNVKTVGEAKARIKQKLESGAKSAEMTPTILDLFKKEE